MGTAARITRVRAAAKNAFTEPQFLKPPAPMNHVKYLRAEMPFGNWYTADTNHFRMTDSVSALPIPAPFKGAGIPVPFF